MAGALYSKNPKRQAAAAACIRGLMRDGRSLLDAEFACLSPAERAAISAARNVPVVPNDDEESTLTMIKRRGWDGADAAELGFGFRSIGRGFKKVGKGVGKVGKGVGKVGVGAVKAVGNLALLPLKLLVKATVKLGRALCKAPPGLLELAAQQANVSPKFIPMFCAAVRTNRIGVSAVRRLLPPALKIASKMAASGAFPPIVPVLRVVRFIPGVNRFAGADDLGSYGTDPRNPAIRAAVDTMELIALSDHLGLLEDADAAAMGLTGDDRALMQSHLAASISPTSTPAGQSDWIPIAAVATAFGFGVYLGTRRK